MTLLILGLVLIILILIVVLCSLRSSDTSEIDINFLMYYIFACKNKTMSLLVCVENALCKVSRFKEGKAEYHGVGCYTENGTM